MYEANTGGTARAALPDAHLPFTLTVAGPEFRQCAPGGRPLHKAADWQDPHTGEAGKVKHILPLPSQADGEVREIIPVMAAGSFHPGKGEIEAAQDAVREAARTLEAVKGAMASVEEAEAARDEAAARDAVGDTGEAADADVEEAPEADPDDDDDESLYEADLEEAREAMKAACEEAGVESVEEAEAALEAARAALAKAEEAGGEVRETSALAGWLMPVRGEEGTSAWEAAGAVGRYARADGTHGTWQSLAAALGIEVPA